MRFLGLVSMVVLSATWIGAVPLRAQNVIQNPSFEDPVRAQSYTLLFTGDNIGGVWFVTQHFSDVGHVRHFPGFPEPYPDGDQMIYVGDSGDLGTVVQPISTPLVAGDYQLSFSQGILNQNQVAEARVQLAPITGGSGFGTTYGAPVYNRLFLLGGQGFAPGWTAQSDTITVPNAGGYGLFFIGAQDGLPTLIDNVSLAIPEPGTAMLVAGFGAILVCNLRRRRISP